MPVRKATARWEGDLKQGNGSMKFGSGAFDGAYSFASRFEEGDGTNPEELIGAAHAGCFSMAFSLTLGKAGFAPESIETRADVHLEKQEGGFGITKIVLNTEGRVPDIEDGEFQKHAADASRNCPVSRALAGVDIELNAKLLS